MAYYSNQQQQQQPGAFYNVNSYSQQSYNQQQHQHQNYAPPSPRGVMSVASPSSTFTPYSSPASSSGTTALIMCFVLLIIVGLLIFSLIYDGMLYGSQDGEYIAIGLFEWDLNGDKIKIDASCHFNSDEVDTTGDTQFCNKLLTTRGLLIASGIAIFLLSIVYGVKGIANGMLQSVTNVGSSVILGFFSVCLVAGCIVEIGMAYSDPFDMGKSGAFPFKFSSAFITLIVATFITIAATVFIRIQK